MVPGRAALSVHTRAAAERTGEANAPRFQQGLQAQPTRWMTVRTPSRVHPLLSLDHPLPAHRSSVVVHGWRRWLAYGCATHICNRQALDFTRWNCWRL